VTGATLGVFDHQAQATGVDFTAAAMISAYLTGTAQTLGGGGVTDVAIRAEAQTDIWGITLNDGYTDGRMMFVYNNGPASVFLLKESTSATATDRFYADGNGTYLTLPAGAFTLATYEGSLQRWRLSPWGTINNVGSQSVTGSVSVSGNTKAVGGLTGGNTTLSGAGGSDRLTLKASPGTNVGSLLAWQKSTGAATWTMGNDLAGNGSQDWYLKDNINNLVNLYLNNSATGVSYLSFGASKGGISYDQSKSEFSFFANNTTRLRLSNTAMKISTTSYYFPSLGSPSVNNAGCNGTGAATIQADSSDARGKVTLGTGSTACTMDFTIWDHDNQHNITHAVPICVVNTASTAYDVTVTAVTDHTITFTPSVPGPVTFYYHCDAVLGQGLQ
jgi:hypothetical protein